jgi:hypothetical protein
MVDGRKGRAGLAAVVRLAALGVMVATAGCADEACFSWTTAEGACPSQEEALQFFVPVGCSGAIQSVDSEAEFVEDSEDPFPGDLCCYSVTQSDNDFAFCNGGPPPPF